MNNIHTISLMMVTYNRLPLTKQTVQNIYETTDLPFNFIIIDNGSTDGTVEYLNELASEKDNVHLIFNNKNKGIARGRNQALKKANELNTTWYATVDNDVLLPQNWLSKCINILKANPTYGSIGVSFENVNYPFVNLNGYEFENKPQGNLGTACTVFNKTLHKMIGYYCTEYGQYGEEDADRCFRVRTLGLKLGYLKEHGQHIGEGENDVGEYREFKDECRKKNLELFYKNCRMYMSKQKPIYINYEE
jgi:glycosyltransferase involved in cell wall biosynthesis